MESYKKSFYGSHSKWIERKIDVNNMNINIIKIVIVVVILSGIVVVLLLCIPWLVLMIGGYLSANPPAPQATHGEFPFRLEYEIYGERFIVEDTLICDFAGFGFSTGKGEKFRKWKTQLESGNNRITLLKADGIEIFFFPVKTDSSLGGFFMGDNRKYHPGNENSTFPNALYTTDFDNKQVNAYIISAEDMWERYNLRLISWEITPPIQNTFE